MTITALIPDLIKGSNVNIIMFTLFVMLLLVKNNYMHITRYYSRTVCFCLSECDKNVMFSSLLLYTFLSNLLRTSLKIKNIICVADDVIITLVDLFYAILFFIRKMF